MSEPQSNNPPPSAAGSVCFILTRATGEIEIRGATAERLWAEQIRHPGYRFENHVQLGPMLWTARGRKIDD